MLRVLLTATLLALPAAAQTIERASAGPLGALGNGHSWETTFTGDGRSVVFVSQASNLVPGDTNQARDAFLHDRLSRTTLRFSVASDGTQADDKSGGPAISSDGAWVAYYSWATNLVPGDTNGHTDVFLYEVGFGETTRISVGPGGVEGDGASQLPAVTPDGRFVVYSSDATNLVAGDANGTRDVFVYNSVTGLNALVSVATGGAQADDRCDGSAISADGRYVTFASPSDKLVAGDTNGVVDVFRHDRVSGQTVRVSVASDGSQGDDHSGAILSNGYLLTSISGDGRFVGFHSYATNLVAGDTNGVLDAFVHDCQTGQTERISVSSAGLEGDGASLITHTPSLTPDGRFAAFHSDATNLVAGDGNGHTDVFVRDRQLGTTTRVSLGPQGQEGDGPSTFGVLSNAGDRLSFHSEAESFDPADTNGLLDVYVVDLLGGCLEPETYCTAKTNSLGCTAAIATTGVPSVSAGSGFDVSAAPVLNDTLGILVYSIQGEASIAFQGATLCVLLPLRAPVTASGGSAPPANDCSGTLDLDFAAFAASGVDPTLVAGQPVWAQWWSRDPGLPPAQASNLSDAVLFRLCP